MITLPQFVKIVEVGPRDGLQNESAILPASVRIELIDRLAEAGITTIEAGSFVSPGKVPQMAGTDTVLAGIQRKQGVAYPVLIPNMKGLEAALGAQADELAVFGAASETFSQKNTNRSISKSLDEFALVVSTAIEKRLRVRGYVSCALGCPYEGDVRPQAVVEVASKLFEMGCYEISLGDTIGVGTPRKAQAVFEAVAARVPYDCLAAHFHDTYGQALANLLAVMQLGIAVIDSSVAGLGGCPFAPGASGNVASEDVLYMLEGLGIETGVSLRRVLECGRYICRQLGRINGSKAARALSHRDNRSINKSTEGQKP
jgi:hydroxymethylglutaryl-CoA lyase